MDDKTHHRHIDSQFGERANAYLTSQVHASGNDLLRLKQRLEGSTSASVLDIGCGAGHASSTAAADVAHVTAYDSSQKMLEVLRAAPAERHLHNLNIKQGIAGQLPFEDNQFDIAISRYSAHHWQDPGMVLHEVRRVLKPGGRAIFMDLMSPGIAVLDVWPQTIEALRDTSHVRDYAAGEWLIFFNQGGLYVKMSLLTASICNFRRRLLG